MDRGRDHHPRGLTGWFTSAAPHHRAVFLLSGSALALAFVSVDLMLGPAALAVPAPAGYLLLALVVVGPPTLAAFIPQLRYIEATAAVSLLHADLGGAPAPAQSWSARLRTAVWFWLHLLTGSAVVLAVLYGGVVGAMLVAQLWSPSTGEPILGIDWAGLTGTDRAQWLVPLGVVMIVAMLAVIVACGSVMARLAPPLLGPTPGERIAALDAQTNALVERSRVARELHDSVGHALSVVVLQSAAARRRLSRHDPQAAEMSLLAVEQTARSALEDLDEVLGLLRDETTPGRPGRRQPVPDLTAVPDLVRAVRSAGHALTVTGLGAATERVQGVVSREAYRIVQEAVTNALRHAPGLPVEVSLRADRDRLTIEADNPVPARARPRHRPGGRGLTGIAERTRLLGGSMRITNDAARWRLTVTLPVAPQEVR